MQLAGLPVDLGLLQAWDVKSSDCRCNIWFNDCQGCEAFPVAVALPGMSCEAFDNPLVFSVEGLGEGAMEYFGGWSVPNRLPHAPRP